MKVKRQIITVDELLRKYTNGERDFTYVSIYSSSRKSLFRGVDLSGINLEGSALSVDLSGAILREANFRYTVWGKCSWENTDFSSSDFTGINNGVECVFVRCNFSNTIWDQANLWQSTFEDCDLTGANFDNASLAEVDLCG